MGAPRVGVRGPRAIDFVLSPSADLPDLSVVEALTVKVRAPDGQVTEWATSIVSSSPTQLRARHVFASDGSDVHVPGLWRAYGFVVVDGAEHRTEIGVFYAMEEWA